MPDNYREHIKKEQYKAGKIITIITCCKYALIIAEL